MYHARVSRHTNLVSTPGVRHFTYRSPPRLVPILLPSSEFRLHFSSYVPSCLLVSKAFTRILGGHILKLPVHFSLPVGSLNHFFQHVTIFTNPQLQLGCRFTGPFQFLRGSFLENIVNLFGAPSRYNPPLGFLNLAGRFFSL